jgi:hypothetical protein
MKSYNLDIRTSLNVRQQSVVIYENRANIIQLLKGDTIRTWPLPLSYDVKLKSFKGPLLLKIYVSDVNKHDKTLLVEEMDDPICNRLSIVNFCYPKPIHFRHQRHRLFTRKKYTTQPYQTTEDKND